jgi:23S rRNA pseudouridine1911/1915/1917 synthase
VIVRATEAGRRLDQWLVARLPGLSRSRLRALVEAGHVRVGNAVRKASYRVRGGDRIEVDMPPPAPTGLEPERLPLDVVYEDDAVLVVNKPAGLVVHPGAGQATGTLAAAVLARAPEVAGVGGPRRPGIVHRLDKGTSGLLVVARTPGAYASLTAQLAARTVSRRYLAIVHGVIERAEGVVDAPVGRHPRDRVRMAVRPTGQGKRAVTRYRVLERFRRSACTYLEVRPETGRTHQIRVHLAALGHPVVGDDTYATRPHRRRLGLGGLALHAAELGFVHPVSGQRVAFSAPVPPRLERLLAALRAHEAEAGAAPMLEWPQ